MSSGFTEDDKALIKRLYDLDDKEVFEAEKMYLRSPFSVCKSADIIKGRRVTGYSYSNSCDANDN